MFTYHYSQPDFYRFSLDSIQLAKLVAARLAHRSDLATIQTLDLCAGCGVIGFELSWHLPSLRKIDFLEVQSVYTPHFTENVQRVNRKELELNWHLANYDVMHAENWKEKYDLIISNPPYFHPKHGMLSPSQEKNRCRFFIDSDFNNYISAIVNSLADNGEAYILLRSSTMHGENAYANLERNLIDTPVTATLLDPIRGTDVVQLKKRLHSKF